MTLEKQPKRAESQTAGYLQVNRAAYDAVADEYRARRESDRQKDLLLIQPFVRLLRRQFPDGSIRVLDLGCGNGLNMSMFAQEGFKVTGIDLSPRMLEVARETCPSAELVCENFLAHPFARAHFHGVFAKAIIHLFPKEDALKLLAKVRLILQPGGVFYVTTTVESDPFEGLRKKTDYGNQISRYRRVWTADELGSAIVNVGFHIVETSYNHEPERSKTWFNIWATKGKATHKNA